MSRYLDAVALEGLDPVCGGVVEDVEAAPSEFTVPAAFFTGRPEVQDLMRRLKVAVEGRPGWGWNGVAGEHVSGGSVCTSLSGHSSDLTALRKDLFYGRGFKDPREALAWVEEGGAT